MDQRNPPPSEIAGHEPIETNVRAVCIAGVVLTAAVAASFLAIFWLMSWLTAPNGGGPAGQQPRPDPAKTDPHWNLPPQAHDLRMREQQYLGTYQWVDQAGGAARVPLDRAMEIIVKNGLPDMIDGAASAASTSPPAAEPAAPAPPSNGTNPQ
jgi:hypothetical protein